MICYQQLAGRAAAAIHGRFEALFDGPPTPEAVLALPFETLRGVGLSGAKATSIRDLAEKVEAGLVELDRVAPAARRRGRARARPRPRHRRVDRAHVPHVPAAAGSTCGRSLDFGVRSGFAADVRPRRDADAEAARARGRSVPPYRSLVAWYCWRAVDTDRLGSPASATCTDLSPGLDRRSRRRPSAAATSSGAKPHSASAVSVFAPAAHRQRPAPRRGAAEAGRGRGLRRAVDVDERLARHVVRMRARLRHREHRREAHLVSRRRTRPTRRASSCGTTRRAARLQRGPLRPVHLRGGLEIVEAERADQREQVRVELRLVRRDRHVLAVGRSRTRCRSARRRRAGSCRAGPSPPSRRGRRRCS